MNDLVQRVTSRKFLLAVGAFITFVANGDYNQALAVVVAYLGVNGVAEAASNYKK